MKRLKTLLHSNWFYLTLICLCFIYVLITTKLIKYESAYKLNDTSLTGKIIDYNIDGNKLDLIVSSKEKVKATYYINSLEEKETLTKSISLGYKINLTGTFSEPNKNTIPNTFNYKKYLYNKKIYRTFSINSIENITKDKNLYNLKNWVLKRINSNEEISSYLKTFILGDKRELSNEDYSNFQTNGISHLFAISGMHITLFSVALVFLLKVFGLPEKKRLIIVITFLWLYAFITGFPASIIRALVFMMFLNINKLWELGLSSIKCLILTIIIILFVSPFMIYDLGFQYSCITVLGLLLSSNYIKGKYFEKLFKTSIIAFIYSLPLTIYNFYEINLLSPLINLIFVPLVSFIIYPIVLLAFIFPFLSILCKPLLMILEWFNTFCSNFTFGIINIPKISFIFILLIYVFIILFSLVKRKIFLIFIAFILIIAKITPKLDSSASVYFLDIGQGDSALIVLPNQKEVVMIDTGGEISYNEEDWQKRTKTYEKSSNTITFLKSLGIRKLDLLILTHGDYDHAGEAINLVNNLKIGEVIFNNDEYNALEQALIKILERKNVFYRQNIKTLNIDNFKLDFLNKGSYDNENDNSNDNENDNSNVIFTELNNYKFLFMGDAGIEVEEELLKKYNLNDIDVLKVGHHGSKTSSSKVFIESTNPKYSIISVGKNNRYGHPNNNVLDNLEDTQIYRTDQDGSIRFKIRNNKLEIETCTP